MEATGTDNGLRSKIAIDFHSIPHRRDADRYIGHAVYLHGTVCAVANAAKDSPEASPPCGMTKHPESRCSQGGCNTIFLIFLYGLSIEIDGGRHALGGRAQ